MEPQQLGRAAGPQQQATGQPEPLAPPPLVLPEVTPATRLLEKRRQQFEADEKLEAAKAAYAAQEVAFKAREEGLKRRDLELQESLLRFTRFLQDNDAKRARAVRRAADEVRLRQEKEAESAALRGEAEALRGQREAVQAELAKASRYQSYLAAVVDAGGGAFTQADDILARHATLQTASADLQAQQAACVAEAEAVRGAAAAAARARAAEALALNNRLAALKRELEAAQAEAAALEAGREYSARAAAARALEAGQVTAAAANLYARCLQRSRVARPRDEASPLAQLGALADFVGDLRAALPAVAAAQGQGQGAAA